MFFNKNEQQTSQRASLTNASVIAHIDSPSEYPRATLFRVSGWVASQSSILAVSIGSQVMNLQERPDVALAHSGYAFASGFSGLARESDISNQVLEITASMEDGDHCVVSELGKDVMLSLSKQEKLVKLRSIFPQDDPEHLIDQSLTVEVRNDDTTKFERLKSIVRCSQCTAVGLRQHGDGLRCENDHGVDTVENAYIYLNSEMRSKHNIKNNMDPASRAQDPLAVALIGKFKDGLILDCGAGLPFQNYKNVINFEIEKFSNTDVIGVGEELPFADHSFDAVFSFSVLEHVKDPFKCAAEIERVLKPGGIIYSSVPFLIPVHGYPHHYYNMTQQGLANLFSDNIDIVQGGVPISGHPLFTLNSVANIWNNSLSENDQEAFKDLTLREIMGDPSKLITESHCASLPQETQALISCTNMILAKKKGD
ncbi:MAG: SAM-dependent methyltransferase [Arenicella sp.]|jgi:SAM-dependent methyltransferase